MSETTSGIPDDRFRSRLLSWSLLRLSELGRSIEYTRFTRRPEQPVLGEALADGVVLLRQVIDAFYGIAKSVVDVDPRDLATLRSINGYVDNLLRHWDPQYDHPTQWEVEALRQRDDVEARRLAELEREAAKNEERAAAKREIDLWRGMNRLALLWWVERYLRTTSDVLYVEPWEEFGRSFGSIESAAAITDAAMTEAREGHRWLGWVPMPTEAFHGGAARYSPAVDSELLRTFVVVALRQIDPEAAAPDLGRVPNITARVEQVEQYAQEALQNEAIAPLLPDDDLEPRVDRLLEAVRRSRQIEERAEEERIIRSELDPEVVANIQTETRSAWRKHRLLPGLLQQLGLYSVEEFDDEAAVADHWYGRRNWELKLWYVAGSHVGGVEQMAAERGGVLADAETARVLEEAEASPEYHRPDEETIAQGLRAAIAEVRQRGEELVVLAPLHWRWPQVLDLEPSTRYGGNATPPGWLLPDLQARFVGSADGVPVIDIRDPEMARLLVVAVDAFASWTQWRPRGEDEVHVSLTAFDEAAAAAAIAENDDLFRGDTATTDEERAREVQKHVVFDVHEYLEIEVVDSEAARWLAVRDDELE